jgi:hypothetical protein
MYRVASIAVLWAAVAFPLSLEGQMRAAQLPSAPARVSVGPHVHAAQFAPAGSRVMTGHGPDLAIQTAVQIP